MANKTVNTLRVLDELDTYRRQHSAYDFPIRVAQAIIANQAGYKNRNEWCKALKDDKTTAYYKAYGEGAETR